MLTCGPALVWVPLVLLLLAPANIYGHSGHPQGLFQVPKVKSLEKMAIFGPLHVLGTISGYLDARPGAMHMVSLGALGAP